MKYLKFNRKFFASSGKNFAALGIGLIFTIGGVLGVNVISTSLLAPAWEESVKTKYSPPGVYSLSSKSMGWILGPNQRTTVTRYKSHWTIYEYTFDTDEFGRRVVKPPSLPMGKEFLILLGGSVAFGEGLEDEQTIGHQISNSLPDFHVYNYAVPGYGLAHVLAQAQNIDFKNQVKQKKGVIVYVFPTFHVDRFFGGLQSVDWASAIPYFKWFNGRFIRDGFIHETRWFYTMTEKIYNKTILRRKFLLSWPFHETPEDFQLACLALSEVKRLISSHFEESRFLLVLSPPSGDPSVELCLSQVGIEFLNLRDIYKLFPLQKIAIKGDGHPTELGAGVLSDQITEYLKKKGD